MDEHGNIIGPGDIEVQIILIRHAQRTVYGIDPFTVDQFIAEFCLEIIDALYASGADIPAGGVEYSFFIIHAVGTEIGADLKVFHLFAEGEQQFGVGFAERAVFHIDATGGVKRG